MNFVAATRWFILARSLLPSDIWEMPQKMKVALFRLTARETFLRLLQSETWLILLSLFFSALPFQRIFFVSSIFAIYPFYFMVSLYSWNVFPCMLHFRNDILYTALFGEFCIVFGNVDQFRQWPTLATFLVISAISRHTELPLVECKIVIYLISFYNKLNLLLDYCSQIFDVFQYLHLFLYVRY